MALDKFKQLKDMRRQAKELEKQLDEIVETYEKGGVKAKVTGGQKVIYVEIDGEKREDVVNVITKAMKKVQKKAAKKMMEMGGGLSGLFGQ